MATPWRHPTTKAFYIYRQIPAALRPAFGGKQFWKKSLRTRDPEEAKRLFIAANSELENRFNEARIALARDASKNALTAEAAMDLVVTAQAAYDKRTYPAFSQVYFADEHCMEQFGMRGLVMTPRDETLDSISSDELAVIPLPGDLWLEAARTRSKAEWVEAASIAIDSLIRQSGRAIVRSAETDVRIATAFAEVLRNQQAAYRSQPLAGRRRSRPRLRPNLTLSELQKAWETGKAPTIQTAGEGKMAMTDLIALVGDLRVMDLTKDDLLDYRDEAARLPAAMARADRQLPFPERVGKLAVPSSQAVSADTLKKRIGLVQAMLSYADEMRWISHNVATKVPIIGYSRGKSRVRSFRNGELKLLFESQLFLKPETWSTRRAVTDVSLFWLFLFGLTCGARLEEIGKARLEDVQQDLGTRFIDIDGQVKTEESRRVVPVHDLLIELGFEHYRDALIAAGHDRLFPDLKANSANKLTKEASRRANRYIDDLVSKDSRLVFHSFRHKFKDLAVNAGISDSIADKICGHAPATVGRRYGEGAEIGMMHKQMMKINISMVDWDAVKQALTKIDWKEWFVA